MQVAVVLAQLMLLLPLLVVLVVAEVEVLVGAMAPTELRTLAVVVAEVVKAAALVARVGQAS